MLGNNNQFRIYTYIRNPHLEQNLLKIAHNFWVNHVIARIPPKATNTQDTKNLYPTATEEVKQAEEEIIETVKLLAEIKSQINLLKKQSEELQCNIQNFMGESAAIVDEFNNLLVTWKTINAQEKFDEIKFKADYPELYRQYMALTKPTRRFEVKTKGGQNNV